MELSNELISQFVKATKDDEQPKTGTVVNGTTVEYNGKTYVKIDGSELLTPVNTTAAVKSGERVTVTIKDHTATVTGNLTSPSASNSDVQEIGNKISEFEIVVADKVSTKELDAQVARIDELRAENVSIKGRLDAGEASIGELEADNVTIKDTLTANKASIDNLEATKISAEIADAKYATIENLNAANADIYNLNASYVSIKGRLDAGEASIGELEADNVTIKDSLTANKASIDNLEATKISAEVADAKYATIENLNAANADIYNLNASYATFKTTTTDKLVAIDANIVDLGTTKLDAESAEITYATIDFSNIGKAAIEHFYATSGLIKDVVVGDGTVTGELVGVTIKGDLIEGNTIKAEKLVIKGTDGLYYKLNTDGITTEAEQTDQNSLNGSVIMAKSITATKIAVDDLVAFDATIGGFNITSDAIYSGVKDSPTNTTRGIYMDNQGQLAVGDSSNFLRYYKDQNGSYKLEISANSVTMSAGGTTIEDEIASIKDEMATIQDEVTTLLRIESSRGTVFKNDQVSTVLSAVIYRGSKRITDLQTLKSVMGNSAYLEWSWQHLNDDSYGVISADDSRLGNDGFTFTLSPADVNTKVTFMCTLNT